MLSNELQNQGWTSTRFVGKNSCRDAGGIIDRNNSQSNELFRSNTELSGTVVNELRLTKFIRLKIDKQKRKTLR